MNRLRWPVLLLVAIVVSLLAAQERQPRPPRRERPRAEGPLVRIPSKVAGEEGIVLRLVLPKRPRFEKGAPVVVHVPGGFSRGSVDSSQGRLDRFGFVEVLLAFPGGRSAPQAGGKVWKSGGVYDTRGENCIRALADIMAFAQGRLRTLEGKTIQDVAGDVPVLRGNVGIIGWSLGGNIVPAALAADAEAAAGMAWYASHESPYGDGVINGEFGTRGTGPNPFYDPSSGKLDLSTLRYDPNLAQRMFARPQGDMGGAVGCLFLDANGNNRFDKDADFQLNGVADPGPPPKYYYSRRVTAAVAEKKLFGPNWPEHIATLEQVERFLDIRDGVTPVPTAVKNAPQLAILIWAAERDHVQATPDHRHIRLQYDAFLEAGVRWARVNPDAHYMEWVLGRRPSRVVQNPAGKRFDSKTIRPATEPVRRNGGASTAEGLAAAACELADRTQAKEWSATLTKVLLRDAPRAESLRRDQE